MRRPSLVGLPAFGSVTMASEIFRTDFSPAKRSLESIGQMYWAHIPDGALDLHSILQGSIERILAGEAIIQSATKNVPS